MPTPVAQVDQAGRFGVRQGEGEDLFPLACCLNANQVSDGLARTVQAGYGHS